MSYDIYLMQGEEVALVQQRHQEGAVYCLGGSDEAHLKITYNYSSYYYQTICEDKGIRWLYGRQANSTVPVLVKAIQELGCQKYIGNWWVWETSAILDPANAEALGRYRDGLNLPENAEALSELIDLGLVYDTGGYWKPDPGNAGYALSILLTWALELPEATWAGD